LLQPLDRQPVLACVGSSGPVPDLRLDSVERRAAARSRKPAMTPGAPQPELCLSPLVPLSPAVPDR